MFEMSIVLGIAVAVAVYLMYVQLIKARNGVEAAVSSIDIQLRKRYDKIPNLIKLAKKYMDHEAEVFIKVTEARSGLSVAHTDPKDRSSIREMIKNDQQFTSAMGELKVTFENYPELISSEAMINAMRELDNIEDDIASTRRLYNSEVLNLNNLVDVWPHSAIAKRLGLERLPMYRDADKKEISKSIDVNDLI